MRPIARGDLVVTEDGYYALVLLVESNVLVVQLSNGLECPVLAETVRRLALHEGEDDRGPPASFAEAMAQPEPGEQYDPEPVHGWFSLTYAAWIILPRVVLQAMPAAWQRKFVALLEQLDEAFDWVPEVGSLHVQLKDDKGRYLPLPPELCDYRRGSVEHLRRGIETGEGAQ